MINIDDESDTGKIGSRNAAAQSGSLSHLQLNQSACFWLQSQPEQAGRITIMQHYERQTTEILPTGYSVKSRVHEYGGGAYCVKNDQLCFCNESDQRLYLLNFDTAAITPITPESTTTRYADLEFDPVVQRLFCIREQITSPTDSISEVISIDLLPPYQIKVLHQGCDFYSSPRISNDARRICWVSWDHPDMPWDQTTLWIADLADQGQVNHSTQIKFNNASILQPRWSPNDQLYFISDHDNWWNIYRLDNDEIKPAVKADFDFAKPPWIFGLSNYSFLSADKLVCCHSEYGSWVLSMIDVHTGQQHELSREFSEISFLQANAEDIYFIGARADSSQSIQLFDPGNNSSQTLFPLSLHALPFTVSIPEAFTFASVDGHTGHALFYRPQVPITSPPPLLVMAHGGPTSQFECALDIRTQYWTSQGFAVCAVNYAGSSGYGREYRDRLNKQWGVLDVSDCVAAAQELVLQGEVDAHRTAIRGNSSGGYTVLCALCFHSFFQAGVSYYGISDMLRLYHETHKFESHYIDKLIGPLP